MKIIIIQENPPTLQLLFDPVEVKDTKFTVATAEATKHEKVDVMVEDIKTEIAKPDEIPEASTIILTKEKDNKLPDSQNIGRFIDETREKYCGDVISEVDEKTGEDKKDYTKIPQFKIGVLETIDTAAEKIEEDVTEAKPEPVEDEVEDIR